jgi:hypothetical protein
VVPPRAQSARRGPGRPSKNPAPPKIPFRGIAPQPTYQGDVFEIASSYPLAWKSLFQFFDKLKVGQIFLSANQSGMRIFTIDGSESIKIRAEIEGKRLNHYFCGQELALNINHAHLTKIFSTISRNFHLIQFFYMLSDPSNLTISLTDVSLQKSHFFPVRVSPVIAEEWWGELDRHNAEKDSSRVIWTVPDYAFRKSHEIATQTSSTMTVELVGGGHLTYKFTGNGTKDFSEVYTDSEKIKLQTLLQPGEVFVISYNAMAGKILSSSVPADAVTIHCSESKPLLFISEEQTIGIKMMAALKPS